MCNNKGFVRFNVMESGFIFSRFNLFHKTDGLKKHFAENDNRYPYCLSNASKHKHLFKAFLKPTLQNLYHFEPQTLIGGH